MAGDVGPVARRPGGWPVTRHPASRLAAVLTATAATLGLAYGLARGATPDPKTEPVVSGRWCTTPQVTDSPLGTVSTVQCYPTRGDLLADQLLAERALLREKVKTAYNQGLIQGRKQALHRPSAGEAIALASFVYGVPEATLRRLAWCESRMNPRALNRSSGAAGLLQFLPSTWRGNRFGRAGFSVWSPYANAMGAAYHISRYGTGAWECR